jgi:predicted membrane protein DUF2306
MDTTVALETGHRQLSTRGLTAGLSVVTAIGLVFIAVAALPYLDVTTEQFGMYWTRRWWLLSHIAAGIVALLSGPLQLWLGLTASRVAVHRRLGLIYIVSLAVSASAGYYLAFNTDMGWLFGAGLVGLATAWVVTTGMAVVAIRCHLYEQHKEWMIRSYVVTTAFVSFRIVWTVVEAVGIGTLGEQLTLAAWFSWAGPLLITEAILQGRKIIRESRIVNRE